MYKLYSQTYMGQTTQSVIRFDGIDCYTSIPFAPDNTDYQEYLAWLAAGNTPEPAED
jgi:hypothetical protein